MLDAIEVPAAPIHGVLPAANRRVSEPTASPLTDAMAECEFRAEAPAGIDVDAKLALAVRK